MFYTRYIKISANAALRIALQQASRDLNVSQAHLIRCATIPDSPTQLYQGNEPETTQVDQLPPVIPDPKNTTISLLLTEEEIEVIDRAALKTGLSRAQYMRDSVHALLQSPNLESLVVRQDDHQLQERALHLLKQITATLQDNKKQ